jgi:acetyl-CoA carboxylase biotin carboxyl carrier protein
MDLKEIQNLIKFVANSGVAEVKLEMDDIKITIRTTIEGTATETTYVQLPAHNQQAMPVQNAAPVAPVVTPCCRRK